MKMVAQKNSETVFGFPTYVEWENNDRDPAYETGGGFAWLLFECTSGRPLYAEPVTSFSIVLADDGKERTIKRQFLYHIRNISGRVVNTSTDPEQDERYVSHDRIQKVLNILKRGKLLSRIGKD